MRLGKMTPAESLPEEPKSTPPSTPKKSPILLQWTGFAKSSSLLLFSLTVGIFSIFSGFNLVSELPVGHRIKPNPPGEHFWFRDGLLKLGMDVHLYSVLPAGILLPLQFLPVVRRRCMKFHRISGRLLFLMLVVGNISALSIAHRSFGGTITTQGAVILLASLTTFSLFKSWTSARSLHLDQHRAWAIRTWAYAGSILTLRIFMIIIAIITQKVSPNAYRSVTTCEQIIHMYQYVTPWNSPAVETLYTRYPACSGWNLTGLGEQVYVIVTASLSKVWPEERAALLNMIFGVSGWAAGVVHILVVEWYLSSTREEDERLKMVSLVRRRAVGLEKP